MGVGVENVILVFKKWHEESTALSLESIAGGISVRSAPVSIASLDDARVLIVSSDGKTQFSFALSDPETSFWYFEPREFSAEEGYEELFSSLPEANKYRSTVGVKFSIRSSAPGLGDTLIPAAKIVVGELFTE